MDERILAVCGTGPCSKEEEKQVKKQLKDLKTEWKLKELQEILDTKKLKDSQEAEKDMSGLESYCAHCIYQDTTKYPACTATQEAKETYCLCAEHCKARGWDKNLGV